MIDRQSVFLCDGRCAVLANVANRCRICPILIGQSLSALGASSFEDVSAVGSFHSFAETVFLFSLTFLRLIRSEHSKIPPLTGIGSV